VEFLIYTMYKLISGKFWCFYGYPLSLPTETQLPPQKFN